MIDKETTNTFEAIKQEAQQYHAKWKEICSYFLPVYGSFDERPNTKLVLDYLKLLDCEPNSYLVRLAAGMMSGMTNPSREWFSLGTDKGVWGETPEEAEYLKKRRERIEIRLHKGGVYLTLFKMYMELPALGTYVFLVESDPVDGIRTIPFTIGETFLGMGPRGKIDTFGVVHWMTPREMEQEFGDKCPEHIRSRVNDARNSQERIAVYHLISPNYNRDINAIDAKNKPFRSVYWTTGCNEYLRESGYDRFPVICPRWDLKHYNSVWGTGPGWVTLGAIKALQKVTADECLAVELGVKPPLMADAALAAGDINIKPGGISFKNHSNASDTFLKPVFQAGIDIAKAELLVAKLKTQLKNQFFVDVMLTMLSDTKTGQTATEVAEKVQERLTIMGPVLERLVQECHKPLIEIVDAINEEQGMYDDLQLPESLRGREIKISFNSVFHEAQKASGTRAVDLLMNSFGAYSRIKPEILDLLDADKLGKLVADKLSLTEMLADSKTVASIRQNRAQQQALAAQQQQDAFNAEISQKLASADKTSAQGLDLTRGY